MRAESPKRPLWGTSKSHTAPLVPQPPKPMASTPEIDVFDVAVTIVDGLVREGLIKDGPLASCIQDSIEESLRTKFAS